MRHHARFHPRAAAPAAAALALLLAASPGCAAPPEPAATLPPALAQTAGELRSKALLSPLAFSLLRSLVTEVGHRMAGSPQDARAVEWARARLSELGFDRVWTEPATVPHWVRGENTGAITAPFPQEVVLLALGGSVATPDEGLEAEVLRTTSLAEVEALPERAAAGKIVFIDERMERTRDATGYRKAVAKRGGGASAAAKKGAIAVLIRSAGTSTARVAHTGGVRYAEDVPKIPAASLSNADADVLEAQLERGGPVRFRLRLTTRTLPDAQSASVIAELRGREKPEEIVLLGAHLDSWDAGQGAQDDGAGCAITMAAAHLIGELPARPRRTVRVVLFANEEYGLSGARAYAEAHAAELGKHVAAVEADLGAGKVWVMESGVAEPDLPKVEALAALLAPLGITAGGNEGGGGADLRPLVPARVPLFSLEQDVTRYFDLHHTANDTLAEVDPEGLKQNVAAYATWAYAVAEMPETFGRAPEKKDP